MRPRFHCSYKLFAGLALFALASSTPAAPPADSMSAPAVRYNADAQLLYPANYHEWVFLSSGVGMTYGPLGNNERPSAPKFDNVFVNPDSYRAFLKTGHWPDKTMFVLEVRNSASHASINHDGHFQTSKIGVEAEVKDSSTKSGEWTFYGFGVPADPAHASARPIPRSADCYSCHAANTAVENTFVQFYPDLFAVAIAKGTLNPSFQISDSR